MCDRNGRWNGTIPQCKLIDCKSVNDYGQNIYNAAINYANGTNFGAVAEIQCIEGHVPFSLQKWKCGEYGKWNKPSDFKCAKVICSPPVLSPHVITTGDRCLSGNSVFNENCSYSCPHGFEFKGSRQQFCVYDNNNERDMWSPTNPPLCIDILPPSLECQNHTIISKSDGILVHLNTLKPKVSDNSGYVRLLQISPAVDDLKSLRRMKLGLHFVKYKAYDNAGNTATCTQSIHIQLDNLEAVYCPKGLMRYGPGVIQWNEPSFKRITDNTHVGSHCSPFSGSRFTNSSTTVYCSSNGGIRNCTFTVSILENPRCSLPTRLPSRGAFVCDGEQKTCRVVCKKGYSLGSQMLEESYYQCNFESGKTPHWVMRTAQNPFEKHPVTAIRDCSRVRRGSKKKLVSVSPITFSGLCKDNVDSIKSQFAAYLNTATQDCQDSCSYEVNVYCKSRNRRSKGEVSNDTGLFAEIQIIYDIKTETNSIEREDERQAYDYMDELIFGLYENFDVDYDSSHETWSTNLTCPLGFRYIAAQNTGVDLFSLGHCETCVAGEILADGQCIACPLNTYHNLTEGCLPCPAHLFTSRTGAVSLDECREQCPLGSSSRIMDQPGLSPCQPCKPGSYQPAPGQPTCLDCAKGQSTPTEGAISSSQCKAICSGRTVGISHHHLARGSSSGSFNETTTSATYYDDDLNDYRVEIGREGASGYGDNGAMSTSGGGASSGGDSGEGDDILDADSKPGQVIGLSPCTPCPYNSKPNAEHTKCIPCTQNDYDDWCPAMRCPEELVQCSGNGYCQATSETKTEAKCICNPRFKGETCEEKKPLNCRLQGCRNFKNCSEDFNGVVFCECKTGFTGKNCNVDLTQNTCKFKNCSSNGRCLHFRENGNLQIGDSGILQTRCECFHNWYGDNCQHRVDRCQHQHSCSNRGVCSSTNRDVKCDCDPGFAGATCQLTIDYCVNKTCPLSECANVGGRAVCICPPGLTGAECEIPIDFCANSPCGENGVCFNEFTYFFCNCKSGYTGDFCQKEVSHDFDLVFRRYSSGDCVRLRGIPDLDEFTVSTWLRSRDLDNYGALLSYATRANSISMSKDLDNEITVYDYGYLTIAIHDNLVKTNIVLNDGNWQHLAIVWNSKNNGSLTIYVNETLKTTIFGVSTNRPIHGGGIMFIGQYQSRFGISEDARKAFVGELSRFSLYSKALSRGEIAAETSKSNCSLPTSSPAPSTNSAPADLRQYLVIPWTQTLANIHGRVYYRNTSRCMDINECHLTPYVCDEGEICRDRRGSYACLPSSSNSSSSSSKNPYGDGDNTCQGAVWCLNGRPSCTTLTCVCEQGFTGTHCEDLVDACSSSPCQYGGQCQSFANTDHNRVEFACNCPPLTTGQRCEQFTGDPTTTEPCVTNVCNNMGTCWKFSSNGTSTDTGKHVVCYCAYGFTGPKCNERSSDCHSNPCMNSGICTPHNDGYTCSCIGDWRGSTCSVLYSAVCLRESCLNQGICELDENSVRGYKCNCPDDGDGYGYNCESITACSHSPCLNNGTCVITEDNFKCMCPSNSYGNTCEYIYNAGEKSTSFPTQSSIRTSPMYTQDYCSTLPCENGATCDNHLDTATCRCTLEYSGTYCTTKRPTEIKIFHSIVKLNIEFDVGVHQTEHFKIIFIQQIHNLYHGKIGDSKLKVSVGSVSKGSVIVNFEIHQTNFLDDDESLSSIEMRRILETSLQQKLLGQYSASTEEFSFTENGVEVMEVVVKVGRSTGLIIALVVGFLLVGAVAFYFTYYYCKNQFSNNKRPFFELCGSFCCKLFICNPGKLHRAYHDSDYGRSRVGRNHPDIPLPETPRSHSPIEPEDVYEIITDKEKENGKVNMGVVNQAMDLDEEYLEPKKTKESGVISEDDYDDDFYTELMKSDSKKSVTKTLSSPENFYVTFPGESSKDGDRKLAKNRPHEIDEIELSQARQLSRDADPSTSGEPRSTCSPTPTELAYEEPVVTRPKYENQQN